MDASYSVLKTIIERVRGYLDDADFDAKYEDAFLVRHIIMPALVDVWSRCSLNADNPVLLSFDITLVGGQECYVIPPCVGEVHEIVQYTGAYGSQTNTGVPTDDMYPRHRMSVGGPIWSLEGNMICFRPFPPDISSQGNQTWTVRYTSNGDMMPHYADGSTTNYRGSLNAARTVFTLASSTTLGALDKRENAYAGQTLRLIGSSNNSLVVFEERVIASYNPVTREATLKRPFSSNVQTSPTAYYAYEVCPPQSQGMVEAVSLACALKLGAWRKISQAHAQMLQTQYRAAIKTIGDNLANMQMRNGKSWWKDTRDNPRWYP
jgi:hypothetical protein